MKTRTILSILFITIILVGCKKEPEEEENLNKTGTLQFRTVNPRASTGKSTMHFKTTNPSLTGDTTKTVTTSLKLGIGDVWVSQGEVSAGNPNNLEWVRLTSSTNTELKLFEDYTFSPIELPSGTYKSMKITFRNIFYRYNYLVSDTTVKYELLETMGSWTAVCDENDTTWAKTNYFGPNGNHTLNSSDVFELASEGEKIGGFTIEPNKTALVSWRFGAGYTGICYTYLIDENHNLEWDCGIDRMDFECIPDDEDIYMWDFLVEYL